MSQSWLQAQFKLHRVIPDLLCLPARSVEFIYAPLNQAHVPHFDPAAWDPLDDRVR